MQTRSTCESNLYESEYSWGIPFTTGSIVYTMAPIQNMNLDVNSPNKQQSECWLFTQIFLKLLIRLVKELYWLSKQLKNCTALQFQFFNIMEFNLEHTFSLLHRLKSWNLELHYF